MKNHHVITIGTSAGGIQALKTLVSQLPKNFPASIHVVLHISNEAPSNLPTILKKAGQLSVSFSEDGERIEPGHIYIAPPDFHQILEYDRIRVIRGPRENRMRPAIDPLFRSAAVAYTSYATGVILTGMLDDGTAGLQAIKACGGTAIVQDPKDAAYSSMPESAISNVKVDWVVPLNDIAALLQQRIRQTPPVIKEVPAHLLLEVPIAQNAITKPAIMDRIGKPVAQSCPSCGGPLWQMKNGSLLRYRCHIGHAFSNRTLVEEQSEATEKALWIALRTLEERARLLKNMSDNYAQKGATSLAKVHEERSAEAFDGALHIRSLIRDLRIVSEFPTDKKPKKEAS
ncbi:chemotaxis protein CheB [Myxosarcina sp. GI1]|uniref:chemotaxis protein CheB n=1 Tax=Myxosarcina sp. GI1 TaxID=1541065 RepID=UPI0006900895|nr:chemotaxis protein CheB [Myxosarcina sp. GI1]